MNYQLLLGHVSTECQAAQWQAAADKLNAYTLEVPNKRQWTFSDLETVGNLGFAGFVTVARTMDAAAATMPELKPAITAMSSGQGITLYQPERQAMIDQLAVAGSWPDELKTAVKEAGIEHKNLVGGSLLSPLTVTAEEVESVWTKGQLESWWTSKLNGGINEALVNGDSATLKTLLTTAAGEL